MNRIDLLKKQRNRLKEDITAQLEFFLIGTVAKSPSMTGRQEPGSGKKQPALRNDVPQNSRNSVPHHLRISPLKPYGPPLWVRTRSTSSLFFATPAFRLPTIRRNSQSASW